MMTFGVVSMRDDKDNGEWEKEEDTGSSGQHETFATIELLISHTDTDDGEKDYVSLQWQTDKDLRVCLNPTNKYASVMFHTFMDVISEVMVKINKKKRKDTQCQKSIY